MEEEPRTRVWLGHSLGNSETWAFPQEPASQSPRFSTATVLPAGTPQNQNWAEA